MPKKIKKVVLPEKRKLELEAELSKKLKSNDMQSQIEAGEIVEQATQGKFGILLRLIINGIIDEELISSRTLKPENQVSADRVLGRIESLNNLQERLDRCVEIKQRLMEEIKEESRIS